MAKTTRYMGSKMVRRKGPKASVPPYPTRVEKLDRCPECRAKESCYACVTSGGWVGPALQAQYDRHDVEERSP